MLRPFSNEQKAVMQNGDAGIDQNSAVVQNGEVGIDHSISVMQNGDLGIDQNSAVMQNSDAGIDTSSAVMQSKIRGVVARQQNSQAVEFPNSEKRLETSQVDNANTEMWETVQKKRIKNKNNKLCFLKNQLNYFHPEYRKKTRFFLQSIAEYGDIVDEAYKII